MRIRFTAAVAVALLAVALGACRADVTVGVQVKDDGSGDVRVTATLDKEAVDRVGAGGPVLADLRRAGWTIEGPRPAPGGNGSSVVTATKSFARPEELPAVMAELAGSSGPFKDFSVIRQRSLLKTTTRLRGAVEIRPCLADFADDDLRRQLGGSQCLGLDPAEVKQTTGVDPDQVVHFSVTARLPGGKEMQWAAPPGQRIAVVVDSRRANTGTIAWLAAAAAAGLALLALLVIKLLKLLNSSNA